MKSVIIADISGFSKDGKPSGHYWKVANGYGAILKEKYNILIAEPKTYKGFIHHNIFFTKHHIRGLKEYNIIENVKKIFFEINNFHQINRLDADIIIFQSSGFLSTLIGLLIFNTGKKKIYLIQYTNRLHSKKYSILFNKIKHKVSGVISGLENVGKVYSDNVLIMPDYIYSGKAAEYCSKYEQPFLICGIMFDAKDIEQAVDVFNDRKDKLKISGYFHDENRFKHLVKKVSENIEIENRYLNEDEYLKMIDKTQYVILPYKSHYENATSGVIYDALFRLKPVITKNLKGMEFVREYKLGFLYEESIEEFFDCEHEYGDYQKNIEKFINENVIASKMLIGFLGEKED